MPRTTRRRIAATAALACAAALVAVPQASADSISYIKDGNVWLSTPDGARQVQVTGGGGYTYASQADDGTIVALVGQRLQKLSRAGQVLADFATPVTDPRTDGKQFFGPFDPVVSPDGTRVAYGYYYQYYGFDPTCNYPVGCIREQLHVGTGLTASDRITSWDEPGWSHQTGWQHPAWIDNSTLMLSEPGAALNEDVILDVAGDGYQTITRWFADSSIKGLRDGEMTRQHTKLAFIGGENDSNLRVYRMTGEPTALPEACYEWSNPKGAFASPTWSPDGTRLAFAQADGVYVAAVPDLGAACSIGTDAGTLAIPGASAPDWGPADVPAKAPSAPGGDGPGGGPGSGPVGPGTGIPSDLDVRVAGLRGSKLAVTLKKGLGVRVSASDDAKAVVTVSLPKALGKKLRLAGVIGRKTVVATSGGTDTRVPLSAAAKRKLRGRAAVSFVVKVTVGGKPFATQTIRVVR